MASVFNICWRLFQVLHRAGNTTSVPVLRRTYILLWGLLYDEFGLRENQKLIVTSVIFLEQKEISGRKDARADETD
jgi:hypothetical protein